MTATDADGREQTALYRLFDADTRLLYVGITNAPESRWNQHRIEKAWWKDVAEKAVTWFDSRQEAESAESVAIRTEHPIWNVKGRDKDAMARPSNLTGDWRAIGRAVFLRRAELGMASRQDLAERAGVHINTIGRIERGAPLTRRGSTWDRLEAALRWPSGYLDRLARGKAIEADARPIPEDAAAAIKSAVLAAVATVEPDVTVRQAREIAEAAVTELRRRELLPPDTAGLTSGTPK